MKQSVRMTRRPVEVQRAEDSDHTTVSGYGAVFYRDDQPGTQFEITRGVHERIMPGAFDDTDFSDVFSMFNHEPNQVLGRTTNGTLRLSVDSIGLRYEVDLPNTTTGRDVATSIERGDIDGSSFWFMVAPDGMTMRREKDGTEIVELTRISQLREVGPVTIPAYKATSAKMRSEDAVLEEVQKQKEHEEQLQKDRDLALATVTYLELTEGE